MNDDSPHDAPRNMALQKALEKLRREGEALRSARPELAERVEPMLAELERRVRDNDTRDLQNALRHRVKAAVRDFAAEHPRFTAALTDVLAVLGNTGI
ncbi:MAG TPA: DUF4404 family protein [Nevskiaceae bacterium]